MQNILALGIVEYRNRLKTHFNKICIALSLQIQSYSVRFTICTSEQIVYLAYVYDRIGTIHIPHIFNLFDYVFDSVPLYFYF